jgi:HSP20 family molecular chaperone IbpA
MTEISSKEKQVVGSEERTRPERLFVPEVDIRETDDALWLYADMPGVAKDALNVELEGDVLRLEGAVSMRDYEGLTPLYTEYDVGHWARRFTFPDASRFDASRVSARLANGVLEVCLPKAERAKARTIPIT